MRRSAVRRVIEANDADLKASPLLEDTPQRILLRLVDNLAALPRHYRVNFRDGARRGTKPRSRLSSGQTRGRFTKLEYLIHRR